MVNQENLNSLLGIITPRIIEMVMAKHSVGWQAASALLYSSTLYEALEAEDTKLWHLSAETLFDLLEEELATGAVQTITEEQV